MKQIAQIIEFYSRHKRLIISLGIITGLLLLISLYQTASAPVRKLNAWKELSKTEEEVTFTKGLDSLQRQIAYKKALLTFNKKDSIHLVLNVPDSSLGLFMNGLIIYRSKLSQISLDPLLKKLPLDVYYSQFSHPIQSDTSRASIIKEPVIEKEAPKTQEEFLASVTMPDSVKFDPVFIEMNLNNGIDLVLEHNGMNDKASGKARKDFYAPNKWKGMSAKLKSVFLLQPIDYRPQIYLEGVNAELTAIYRALPAKPKVVIFYY